MDWLLGIYRKKNIMKIPKFYRHEKGELNFTDIKNIVRVSEVKNKF